MGSDFIPTPLDTIAPGSSAVINNSSSSKAAGVPIAGVNYQQPAGQSIFQAFNQYLPKEMGQSAPITNADAIIQAYMLHLPDIMKAGLSTRPTDINNSLK